MLFRLIGLSLLYLAMGSLYAQDWQPIRMGEKYNYKHSDSTLISHTIWADSVEVANGDSVFYLNRIYAPCDTCVSSDFGVFCQNCLFSINEPQFLNRKMNKIQGGKYHFYDTTSFVIHSLASTNTPWLFDTVNQTQAVVSLIDTMSLFGVVDSIKYISLSTGDIFRLSRSFGLLDFPDFKDLNTQYKLVGLKKNGADFGEQVPGMLDFYDFDVGDVLVHESSSFSGGGGEQTLDIEKKTITQIDDFTDSVVYTYHFYRKYIINDWGGLSSYSGEVARSIKKETFYPKQLVPGSEHVDIWGPYYHTVDYSRMVSGIGQGLPAIKIGEKNLISVNAINPQLNNPDIWVVRHLTFYQDHELFVYAPQKSHLLDSYNGFETSSNERLRGLIINGDTIGDIDPYGVFLSVNEQSLFSTTSISPNPSSSYFQIHIKDLPLSLQSADIEFRVFNTQGQEVLHKTESSSTYEHQIDLSGHSSGLYLLKIQIGDQYLTRKLYLN